MRKSIFASLAAVGIAILVSSCPGPGSPGAGEETFPVSQTPLIRFVNDTSTTRYFKYFYDGQVVAWVPWVTVPAHSTTEYKECIAGEVYGIYYDGDSDHSTYTRLNYYSGTTFVEYALYCGEVSDSGATFYRENTTTVLFPD